jgi:aspartyl-tRNA(Asn)/glutamyl-tRNA(Gln) amidotransferase subunit B
MKPNAASEYEPVIGLEVHAELQTRSKMFCSCPVVDTTITPANTAVCPVCAGMPGVLPVVNQQAVEYALRVALALDCTVAHISLFARKNYFYPDLPKGYQISQYEYPLASNGLLSVQTADGELRIRIRRVHLEEDTGKLTHANRDGESFSLVDLNRAGVPLLEVVSEPDLYSVEEMRAYVLALRELVRYLGVTSGDMEKGVIRFEANVSVRPRGSQELGTRTEIKNLNSFHALEHAVAFEIQRQSQILRQGGKIRQETVGWDDLNEVTFSQRGKEEAHDYRYFPEPDLPPLVIDDEWVERVRAALPELPQAKRQRFAQQYRLSAYDAGLLAGQLAVADYFEAAVRAARGIPPKVITNWVAGELFALMKQNDISIEQVRVSPDALADLARRVEAGEINLLTGKAVLAEMSASGQGAAEIIAARGLEQVSDHGLIAGLVAQVLAENPQEVASYLNGKESLAQWFFGQVMRVAQGKANPQVLRSELDKQLAGMKKSKP